VAQTLTCTGDFLTFRRHCGQPSTAPVMVVVPTATTINDHHHASFDGFRHQNGVTGHRNTSKRRYTPLSAMATPTAHGPVYSPYTGQAPSSGPAWAHPVREAVGQPSSTCIELVANIHNTSFCQNEEFLPCSALDKKTRRRSAVCRCRGTARRATITKKSHLKRPAIGK